VAVVDRKVVDRKKTRAVAAEGYLNFLYSPIAQDLIGKNHYRPRSRAGGGQVGQASSRRSRWSPSTTPSAAGRRPRPIHFADGGVFDRIYKPR
jgi:ABC-type sulfate transport system substrate-binding protein